MAQQSVAEYIAAKARALGLDPRAVLAVARQEGLGGGIGDNGSSFGPFQLHYGGTYPSAAPHGSAAQAQAWAESPAGLDYALSRINSVAHGLHGADAITNIVSRFERPANIPREIAGARSAYGLGVGSSPPLSGPLDVIQQLHGGGGSLGSFSPKGGGGSNSNQLLDAWLIQQAQKTLQGSEDSPDGLLGLILARAGLSGQSPLSY